MAGSSRIKGITIELDGETTGLQKALSNVSKESISIQQELKDVERLLKFDPGNVEALAQKQSLLAKQVENTSSKLNQLKSAQDQVEKQFAKGDIGEKQYRAFQREIQFTEGDLKKLKQSLSKVDDGNNIQKVKKDMDDLSKSTEEAEDKTGELRSGLSQLVVGAAAGVGISNVIEDALDISSLNTKLSISMELDPESIQTVKNAINTVETYGVDGEAALEGVRRQWALNKDATDESNAAVVKGAAAIVASYGDVDFTELIQETNELSKTLGISNEDALGLTYSLLKVGFPPDQLDVITEYGSQLSRAGYNAQEIQGIMAAGVKTGTWNIDVLLDGLKEGRIVLTEFGQGVDEATAGLFEGIGVSGEQLQIWGKAVAEGGEGGKVAMQEVAQALADIDDKTLQNQLGVKVFGTLYEENGTKILDTILGMSDNLTTAADNQNALNEATGNLNADPAIQMKTAISNLMTALAPLLIIIANVIGKIAEWIANNPTLSATVAAIVVAVSILMGVLMGIAPIITALVTSAGALTIGIGALTLPVLAVVAAIAALVAIGVALYANWDVIKVKSAEIWSSITTTIGGAIDSMVNFFTVTIPSALSNMMTFFSELPSKIAYQLGYALASIVKWGADIVSWIALNVPVWITSIVTFFSQLPGNIGAWLTTVVSNIATWGSNMLSTAKTGMTDVFNGIVDTFANLPSKMAEIGTNIVAGIKDGIKSAWEGMTGWIGGLCDSFTEGIKDALDIHSPSRVMFGLGEYTGEGFGNGIESTIGNISKQANAMADAAIPNVDSGSYDMSVNSNPIGSSTGGSLDAVLNKMDSLADAITNMKILMDSKQVGKLVTPSVSNNLAFNSGRKGF